MSRGRVSALAALAGAIAIVVATLTAATRAQVGDRAAIDAAPPPAHWRIPPAPVRAPAESVRMMDLAEGFAIDLIAAEPLVQDPIAFAFDARSRLWVLEWAAYNWPLREVLGLEPAPAPPGRLVVLGDADHDGRMDTRTVFAEFDWPRGFQLLPDGVLVFALPDVLFMRDTDGDDRADTRDVVFGGLPIPVNPHLAPSSPSWTLDNWTYGLQVGQRLRVAAGSRATDPAGRLAGQWGMTHDDYGRLFFSYNQDHIRGSLVPVHYATRNPNYTATDGIDVRIGQDNEVWPHAITPGVNRRAQLTDEGRLRVFTANAAPLVYRGDQFPEAYRGNVFVGESAGRLIRRSVVTEQEGILTSRNAYDGREFLFSHDERVRPVYAATGPDGALYVADMYRGVIEGHIFLTTFLRNQIVDRGLHRPFSGMGRIYRIRHTARPLSTPPRVSDDDVAGWVRLLAHPNGHWRDMAQRTLVAKRPAGAAEAIRQQILTHDDDRARVHALWTLEGLEALPADVLRASLDDASPYVRATAIRLAETRLDEDDSLLDGVIARAGDASMLVRRQTLYSLGASSQPSAREAALRLTLRDIEAPFMADAFMSGLAGREPDALASLLSRDDWAGETDGRRRLVRALATAILQSGTRRDADVVAACAAEPDRPRWQRLALLDGMAAADGPAAAAARPVLDAVLAGVDTEVRDRARELRDAWTTTPQADGADASPADAARIEQGRSAYGICAACHQADGRGVPSLAPPLAGAATVNGPADALIDVVLQGRDVDDAYPSMPPLAGLSDEQLAAILTYVRQAWGNTGGAVAVEEVRGRRAAQGGAR